MREDNSEKRMFYKFIFLLAVTLLIGLVYLWKWTADDPKEQTPEEMFQQEEQEEKTEKKHENKDVSVEQAYIQKHGEKEIEQAKEQAKTVLGLYLLQVTDWDKWDGTVADNYLKSVQKEMSHSTQESVKREL